MQKKIYLLAVFFPSLLSAQISITPKIGFEYSGIAYYPKGAVKYDDIRITVPDGELFLSVELSMIKKKEKFSLAFDRMNLGEGVLIPQDSVVFSNGYVGEGTTRSQTGRNVLFVGFLYDRINKPIMGTLLSWFYGAGFGIGFNKDEAYYRETQNAGYSSSYFGGDNPVSFQRWAKPTGHGVFIKLRSGISLMNKKDREIIILEFFWNQGFRKMVEYTLNYSYSYVGAPGSGHTVTGYRFNNRGTTFGATLGFPIYIAKKKSKPQK